MPSLQGLRHRKKSVQSTKKITSAMKMIAAAKLRKAQERAQTARPYANMMAKMLMDLMSHKDDFKRDMPRLLRGKPEGKIHLFIVFSSNRGLCGGFNSSLVRTARELIDAAIQDGKTVKIICYGHKAREQLRRQYGSMILETISALGQPRFYDASQLCERLVKMFDEGAFDVCSILYNKFISALSHEVTERRLIPFTPLEIDSEDREKELSEGSPFVSLYEYEPSKEKVLEELVPKNLSIQIYRAMLESNASEHGARMTAMDGATRNAEEMIEDLDLKYNRTRQAYITSELIEIISGAEAL